MREATLTVGPSEGWFQSAGQTMANTEGVRQVAMHSIRLMENGAALCLNEFEGDVGRIRKIHNEDREVEDSLFWPAGNSIFGQVLFEPTDIVRRMLKSQSIRQYNVKGAIEYLDRGRRRYTLVGRSDVLRAVINATDSNLQLTVEDIGDYQQTEKRPFQRLTERQREVLMVAIELGYYEEPRKTTHEEIADAFDCTAATIGSLLRRSERTVMHATAPNTQLSDAPQHVLNKLR